MAQARTWRWLASNRRLSFAGFASQPGPRDWAAIAPPTLQPRETAKSTAGLGASLSEPARRLAGTEPLPRTPSRTAEKEQNRRRVSESAASARAAPARQPKG